MFEHLEAQLREMNQRVPSKSEVDTQMEKSVRDFKAQFVSNYTFLDYKSYVDKTLKDFLVTNEHAKATIKLIETSFGSISD